MKTEHCRFELTLGKLATLVLIVLTSITVGCHKDSGNSERKASAKETWQFWQTVQEPLPRNTLFLRVAEIPSENASGQDLAAIGIVLRQMAEQCRSKASQITATRVADVDVAAATYGVKKAQLLVEYARMLESACQLTEKQQQLTSGQTWLLDYLFALARHSDEGEEAWGKALKEELVGKAKTFGNLQVEGKGVADGMRTLADAVADLQSVEMQTRITLAQRYGREFPTSDAMSKEKPEPVPESISADKLKGMREELMKNLLGRDIWNPSHWTFDTMGEFRTFAVMNGTNYGDVIDFEVATHVRGYFSGAEHDFRLLLTYQRTKDGARLMFVKPE